MSCLETPDFMPPSTSKCEGYWNKQYRPVISTKIWYGKDEWIRKALIVEHHTPQKSFRGISFSRIDGTPVGNKEYYDVINNMCWPEGYVEHYIKNYNVMPTQKFYHYINYRYQLLLLIISIFPSVSYYSSI